PRRAFKLRNLGIGRKHLTHLERLRPAHHVKQGLLLSAGSTLQGNGHVAFFAAVLVDDTNHTDRLLCALPSGTIRTSLLLLLNEGERGPRSDQARRSKIT